MSENDSAFTVISCIARLLLVILCLGGAACAQEPKFMLPRGLSARLVDAQFSADSKKLYTLSTDDKMRTWDIASGKLLAQMNAQPASWHRDNILMTPDRQKVVVLENYTSIRILETNTGKDIGGLSVKQGVDQLSFSRDGSTLLARTRDSVKLWNMATLLPFPKLDWSFRESKGIKISANGQKLLCWNDSNLVAFDVRTGMAILKIKLPTPKVIFGDKLDQYGSPNATFLNYNFVFSNAFSPDGSKLAVGFLAYLEKKGWLSIYDLSNHNTVSALGDSSIVSYMQFSSDGRKLLTYSTRTRPELVRKGIIWDTRSLKKLTELSDTIQYDARNGNIFPINSPQWESIDTAEFSADGTRLLTYFKERDLQKLWDTRTGKRISTFLNDGYLSEFDMNRRKTLTAMGILINMGEGGFRIWDNVTGKVTDSVTEKPQRVMKARLSPDNKKIAAIYEHNLLKVINVDGSASASHFDGHIASLRDVRFSPDSKKIITVLGSQIKFWDAGTGSLLMNLSGHTADVNSIQFSDDVQRLISTSVDHTAKVWNLATGAMLYNLNTDQDNVLAAEFSPDHRTILTASGSAGALLWDAGTGKQLGHMRYKTDMMGQTNDVTAAHFNKAGNRIITQTNFGSADLWGLWGDTIKYVTGFEFSYNGMKISDRINAAVFTADGNQVFASTGGGDSGFWNSETGEFLEKAPIKGSLKEAIFSHDGKKMLAISNMSFPSKIIDQEHRLPDIILDEKATGSLIDAQFSPDDRKIITNNRNGTVAVWDAATGSVLLTLKDKTREVGSANLSPDGTRIVTTADDDSFNVWDTASGRLIYSFYGVDSTDYIIQIPSGYYKASRSAARLVHYVSKDLDVIPFSQLDVKYNRPDLVLRALGSQNGPLINSYYKAYQRRIENLGIDTNNLKKENGLPTLDILNKQSLDPQRRTANLTLKITAHSKAPLDRFNIWINEVPLWGSKGLRIKKRIAFDTTVTIKLSQGVNKVEASVMNLNGAESYRPQLSVIYRPVTPIPEKLYFIGIGISDFKEEGHELPNSLSDIRDLAISFKKKYGAQRTVIDTLFDHQVTGARIAALKEKLLKSTINDKVIIAYAGHGLLTNAYDFYLSTYDVDFSNPAHNGLAYSTLENLLDCIPARQKLMLIDACSSGVFDKTEIREYQQQAKLDQQRTIDTLSGQDMKGNFELMQELFVDVGRNTGTTMISAVTGLQSAKEYGKLGHGAFSYTILQAMQDHPHASVNDLKNYLVQGVANLPKGHQEPSVVKENIEADWQLW